LVRVSVVVAVLFVGPLLATSCGGSSSDKPEPSAGTAGSGGSGTGGAATGGSGDTAGSGDTTSSGGTGGTTAAGGTSGSGTGGSGGAPVKPDPIACGADTCDPVTLPFDPKYIAPCCADGNVCGLDATPLAKYGFMLNETCQALHQPGELDPSCPDSAELMIPTSAGTLTAPGFPGCCRADTHTCGYQMDKAALVVTLGLGCVDSTPFLEGGAPSPCGSAGAGN
jgi:hypothetical protein